LFIFSLKKTAAVPASLNNKRSYLSQNISLGVVKKDT